MEFSRHLTEKLEELVYDAARYGHVISLEAYLSSVPREVSVWCVNRLYEHAEMKCTLLTVACLEGQSNVVRMLLQRFHPELETINTIVLGPKENYLKCEGVSALWTATAVSNFPIVKLLVENGANVNFTTSSRSTPFRCACYDGNIKIARYLAAHGADWRLAKAHNDTNLMLCAHFNHLEMVTYLVEELDYDINECGDDGRSALYNAVKGGSLETIQYLLGRGLKNTRSTLDNMSPLIWAAMSRRADLMDALVDHCSDLEWIEAQELLGTAFICTSSSNLNIDKAYEHLEYALNMRTNKNFPKVLSSPIKAFDYRQECQTVEQLNEIRSDKYSLYFEALLIRERLLGTDNDEYHYSLRYQGAVLADESQFLRAVRLWFYEQRLCRQYSIELKNESMRDCAALLAEMIANSTPIPSEDMVEAIAIVTEELTRDENDNDLEQVTYNLHTVLYLITITAQVQATMFSLDARREIYKLIRSINRSRNRQTLLHMCLDVSTNSKVFHALIQPLPNICRYPCLATVRLLIYCGANLDTTDLEHNTPLHILVRNPNWNETNTSILEVLYDAGAHLDCVNRDGKTAADIAVHPHVTQWLRARTNISLKCLCARLIRQNNFQFRDRLSLSLVEFIGKH